MRYELTNTFLITLLQIEEGVLQGGRLYLYYNMLEAQQIVLQLNCSLRADRPFEIPWPQQAGFPMQKKPEFALIEAWFCLCFVTRTLSHLRSFQVAIFLWKELYDMLQYASLYLDGFVDNRIQSHRRVMNTEYPCARSQKRNGESVCFVVLSFILESLQTIASIRMSHLKSKSLPAFYCYSL